MPTGTGRPPRHHGLESTGPGWLLEPIGDYTKKVDNMNTSEIPYPLCIVVETLFFCVWHNPLMKDVKASELLERLYCIFGKELVDQARAILSGESSESEQPMRKDEAGIVARLSLLRARLQDPVHKQELEKIEHELAQYQAQPVRIEPDDKTRIETRVVGMSHERYTGTEEDVELSIHELLAKRYSDMCAEQGAEGFKLVQQLPSPVSAQSLWVFERSTRPPSNTHFNIHDLIRELKALAVSDTPKLAYKERAAVIADCLKPNGHCGCLLTASDIAGHLLTAFNAGYTKGDIDGHASSVFEH